jgi:chromosome segregation ATPase
MSKDLTQKLNGTLEDKVDRLITAVQSMDSRLGSLEIKVGSLETKVDQRLRDTLPIWEAVQAQLAEIRESLQRQGESLQRLAESQQRLQEDMNGLRAEVASLRADTEKGFRTFDRRMERQIGEFEKLHAYQRDLEDRVDKIEKLSSP